MVKINLLPVTLFVFYGLLLVNGQGTKGGGGSRAFLSPLNYQRHAVQPASYQTTQHFRPRPAPVVSNAPQLSVGSAYQEEDANGELDDDSYGQGVGLSGAHYAPQPQPQFHGTKSTGRNRVGALHAPAPALHLPVSNLRPVAPKAPVVVSRPAPQPVHLSPAHQAQDQVEEDYYQAPQPQPAPHPVKSTAPLRPAPAPVKSVQQPSQVPYTPVVQHRPAPQPARPASQPARPAPQQPQSQDEDEDDYDQAPQPQPAPLPQPVKSTAPLRPAPAPAPQPVKISQVPVVRTPVAQPRPAPQPVRLAVKQPQAPLVHSTKSTGLPPSPAVPYSPAPVKSQQPAFRPTPRPTPRPTSRPAFRPAPQQPQDQYEDDDYDQQAQPQPQLHSTKSGGPVAGAAALSLPVPQHSVKSSPALVAVQRPAPVVVQRPAPVVVQRPAPVVVQRPAPVVVQRPAPVVVQRPAPVVVQRPAPQTAPRPPPVQPQPFKQAVKAAPSPVRVSQLPPAPTRPQLAPVQVQQAVHQAPSQPEDNYEEDAQAQGPVSQGPISQHASQPVAHPAAHQPLPHHPVTHLQQPHSQLDDDSDDQGPQTVSQGPTSVAQGLQLQEDNSEDDSNARQNLGPVSWHTSAHSHFLTEPQTHAQQAQSGQSLGPANEDSENEDDLVAGPHHQLQSHGQQQQQAPALQGPAYEAPSPALLPQPQGPRKVVRVVSRPRQLTQSLSPDTGFGQRLSSAAQYQGPLVSSQGPHQVPQSYSNGDQTQYYPENNDELYDNQPAYYGSVKQASQPELFYVPADTAKYLAPNLEDSFYKNE